MNSEHNRTKLLSARANEGAAVWPNFFVVGAAKSGTTSLYAGLRQHPDVFMCYPKEPHFFGRVKPAQELRWHFDAYTRRSRYLSLFAKGRGMRAVGEASTSYLWHPRVPARIRRQVPEARIIISLRDPVERAYSHYLMHVREGVQRLPLYEALQQDLQRSNPRWGISHFYVEKGRYAAQVKRYFQVFGPERVKTVLFDDLKRDPKLTLLEIAEFLGLDPRPMAGIDSTTGRNPYMAPRGRWAQRLTGSTLTRVLGETVVPRSVGLFIYRRFLLKSAAKPPMDPRARQLLVRIYQPEIDELEELLGRELPQLRRSWPVARESDQPAARVLSGGARAEYYYKTVDK